MHYMKHKNILAKLLIGLLLVGFGSALFIDEQHYFAKQQLTQQQCQTANMFFEARGEQPKGMQAVAAVVLHRARSKHYPASACAVIFQPKQFSWTHQQQHDRIMQVLNGDLSSYTAKDRQAYLQAAAIAQKPDRELLATFSKATLHYHASSITPSWKQKLKRKNNLKKVGKHVFYSKI